MDKIIRERNCQQKSSGKKVFLLIIAVVLFINIAVVLINRLTPLSAGMASLILILLVMAIAYRVMTRMVSEYYYTLTEKELLFHRAMGIREIKLMEVPYDKILDIRPKEDFNERGKAYYFLCNKNDPHRKLLIFNRDGRAESIVFGPSQKFINSLLKRTGQKFGH